MGFGQNPVLGGGSLWGPATNSGNQDSGNAVDPFAPPDPDGMGNSPLGMPAFFPGFPAFGPSQPSGNGNNTNSDCSCTQCSGGLCPSPQPGSPTPLPPLPPIVGGAEQFSIEPASNPFGYAIGRISVTCLESGVTQATDPCGGNDSLAFSSFVDAQQNDMYHFFTPGGYADSCEPSGTFTRLWCPKTIIVLWYHADTVFYVNLAPC